MSAAPVSSRTSRHSAPRTPGANGSPRGGGAYSGAVAAAREAGLRYVSDQAPGLTRRGRGAHVRYFDARGRPVRSRQTLNRIRRLAIPPAWTQVWICAAADGHIQATGRDGRGRKQYCYHTDWSTVRDQAKFDRMIAFARALPRIRRRVARDLRRPRLDREKVLAAVVRLLETTHVRIGNEEYAQQNRSFGLTTLRNRHVRIGRGTIHFEFRGKSGKAHEVNLHDPRLAILVRRIQELPGQELFQYLDAEGRAQRIDSSDVNEYLREVAGMEFSAKDFRTWAGTVLAAEVLAGLGRPANPAGTKTNVRAAINQVAARLGNTPAVCRKCYIHPAVLEAYTATGVVFPGAPVAVSAGPVVSAGGQSTRLNPQERAVLGLLRQKPRAILECLRGSAAKARQAPRRRAR